MDRRRLMMQKEDKRNTYLTFTAISNCKIRFRRSNPEENNTLKYLKSNMVTWYTLIDNYSISLNAGENIMFKGNDKTSASLGQFYVDNGTCEVSGNIMSLIFGDDYKNKKDLTGYYSAFGQLFINCTGIVNIDNLILPATTLSDSCYDNMFKGCTSLTTVPSDLLPATTLAQGCYEYMFRGCTGLTTAPILPATTLENYCYREMFYNCTGLTTAPILPATTLVKSCYKYMFYGCTNLNYIKAMFTTTPDYNYTEYWVRGVASSGTFVKNSAATWNVTGYHGIPKGWTVQTASS